MKQRVEIFFCRGMIALPLLLFFQFAFATGDSTVTHSNIKKADYYIDEYQEKIDLFE